MCGLAAFLALTPGARASREGMDRALDSLASRGPDQAGRWFASDGAVALGHRRLAILDLAGGRQPLASEDGQVVAIVNGELYGFEALRAELAQRHRFATETDSEVLVHLYEEHGVEALRHLRGEYAFVLWDARKKRLFAARDRFGVKPLCWTRHDGMLMVASQAKALLAAGVTARWNLRAVAQAARLQYPVPEDTLFDGIHALPPGCMLLAEAGEVRVERYWDLDYPRTEDVRAITAEDAVREVRARLDDAVRVRLRSDVPVAFHLSGGVDSCAVLASAAPHLRGPATAYTVRFREQGYDEAALAQTMATHVGARLRVLDVGAEDVITHLPAMVAAGEGLTINGHGVAKYLLNRTLREEGFRVALTGEGADEVFAGYAHLRSDLGVLAAPNPASAGLMLPAGEGISLESVRARLGFVPTWLAAKATLGRRMGELLSADFAGYASETDAGCTLLDAIDARQLTGRGRVEQSLYLWTKTALEGYILRTLGDGMEMAHGIEGRLPFLDHQLFEFVRSLPTHLKIHESTEKYVLRQAVEARASGATGEARASGATGEGRVPAAIATREKHPFLAPPIAGRAPDFLRSTFETAPPFLDRAQLLSLVTRLPSLSRAEQVATEPVLFLALSFCLLHTHFRMELP